MTWLDSKEYRRLLIDSHPSLQLCDQRLEVVPSFISQLKSFEAIPSGKRRQLYKQLAHIFPKQVFPKTLFIGTPFEKYNQDKTLSTVQNPQYFLKKARKAAQQENCELILIPNISADSPMLKIYRQLGFIELPSFPDTVLQLKDSFKEQLACLPQRDRSGIRRNIKYFERAGHTIHQVSNAQLWSHGFQKLFAEAIYTCYLPFYDRAKIQWLKHSPLYFENLLHHPSKLSFSYALNSKKELIGFIINFKDGTHYQAGRIGVHPNYDRRDAVYFRLLYHVIEEAILEGSQQISLEPTAYRLKRHMGAEKKAMRNLLYPTSTLQRNLLKGLKPIAKQLLSHLEDDLLLDKLY